MKSKVSYVALNRAEGPSAECGAVVLYDGDVAPDNYDDKYGHYSGAKFVRVKPGNLAGAVQEQFSKWGHTAPEPGGGYDKCDFKVVWDNGESYEGRFDLQKGGRDGGEGFWESLRGRVGFYACVRRPSHFDDADWAYHCQNAEKNGSKESCEKMLNECEIVKSGPSIKKKAEYGVMSVWERNPEDYLKPYVVICDTDGKVMEEFQKLDSAVLWAEDNQNG